MSVGEYEYACSVRGGIAAGHGLCVCFALVGVLSYGRIISVPPVSVSLSSGCRRRGVVREADSSSCFWNGGCEQGKKKGCDTGCLHLVCDYPEQDSLLWEPVAIVCSAVWSGDSVFLALACNECGWLFKKRIAKGGSPPTVSAIPNI